MNDNVVGWFEIPVEDMERAIKFYSDVFGFEMHHQVLGEIEMAWFPSKEGGTGSAGSLVFNPEYYRVNSSGVLIYFTSPSGDLSNELAKVKGAGGKVILEKKLIAKDIGFMGAFIDSEGNRIALHHR